MADQQLSQLANYLVVTFEKEQKKTAHTTLTVNPVVSRVASWYEKLRNAMEYGEEEVVLRSAIERIIKRRLLLGGNGEKIALPLVKELLWAKYFEEGSIPEDTVEKVAQRVDLYLTLRQLVIDKHAMDEGKLNEWIFGLMSCDIVYLLQPDRRRDTMANFMYQVMRQLIIISDDKEETRDVQVFIAVRRAFAKDDRALLRYHLFNQFFGKLTHHNIDFVSTSFMKGYNEIEREFTYPLKERIFSFVRIQTPVFLVLQDILLSHNGSFRDLITDEAGFENVIKATCEKKYQSTGKKVRTAIIRSVMFILLTKVVFAFLIEGSYERIRYGHIIYGTLVINTVIPALLMVIVGLLIRTPGSDNTKLIQQKIRIILFENNPKVVQPVEWTKAKKKRSQMETIFTLLWIFAFVLSFGGIWLILGKLHFNYISRLVFLFFVTIVSFLSYRIYQTAKMYSVESKTGFITPLIDFLFLPIIQVGRRLTEGVSQVNFLLFIFDFIFETPFKGLFGFAEQWFHFLHQKRENLE